MKLSEKISLNIRWKKCRLSVELRFHLFIRHSIEHATVIKNITLWSLVALPFPTKTTKYYEKAENTKKWVLPEKEPYLHQGTSKSLAVSIIRLRIKFCIGPCVFQLIQTIEWVQSKAGNRSLWDDKNTPCKVFTALSRRPGRIVYTWFDAPARELQNNRELFSKFVSFVEIIDFYWNSCYKGKVVFSLFRQFRSEWRQINAGEVKNDGESDRNTFETLTETLDAPPCPMFEPFWLRKCPGRLRAWIGSFVRISVI